MACKSRIPANQYNFLRWSRVLNGTLADLPVTDLCPIQLVLSAPTGLSATEYCPTQITLDWDDVPDSLTYDIQRSVTSGSGFVTIASGLVSSEYIDNTIPSIQTYYYRVRVNSATLTSNWSAEFEAIDPALVDRDNLLNQSTIDGYTAASGSVLTALTTLISQLRCDGVWDRLDAVWLPATNGDSDFATYNLKDPTQYQLTKINSPLFTSLQGFKGDGVSAYLETNFSLENDGVNYGISQASFSVYYRQLSVAGSGTKNIMGVTDINVVGSRQSVIFENIPANNVSLRLNHSAASTRINPRSAGFHQSNRTRPLEVQSYFNGSLEDSANVSNPLVSSQSPLILSTKIPSGGISSNYSDGEVSFAAIGGDLSLYNSLFYSAIQTYMTSLGTQV